MKRVKRAKVRIPLRNRVILTLETIAWFVAVLFVLIDYAVGFWPERHNDDAEAW